MNNQVEWFCVPRLPPLDNVPVLYAEFGDLRLKAVVVSRRDLPEIVERMNKILRKHAYAQSGWATTLLEAYGEHA